MDARLNVNWSLSATHQLEKFYHQILEKWTIREAEKFLDLVQEFELVIAKHPSAFIASKRKRRYRIGLIHRHVSAIYEVHEKDVLIVALVDNRSKKKAKQ
jgi:plasmid stabilization system protein ParE